jgi:hypothetical protein
MIEAEDVVQDTFAAFVALDELQEDPPTPRPAVPDRPQPRVGPAVP